MNNVQSKDESTLSKLLDITHSFYVYHGTDEDSAINIMSEGFAFPQEIRDDHWLGNGIYFFREDHEQALSWAFNKVENPKFFGKKAAVLQGKITVHQKNFLNLDSRGGLMELEKLFRTMLDGILQRGLAFENKNEAQCRHLLFSSLPDEYYVIQRTFKTPSTKYDSNEMFQKLGLYLNGTQICVRNLSVITEGLRMFDVKPLPLFKSTSFKRKHQKPRYITDIKKSDN